jgi:hypothetical protein
MQGLPMIDLLLNFSSDGKALPAVVQYATFQEKEA